MKIKAFTLAEVLLTLGIIGVIAAVTIPTLTNSNKDKKFLALTNKALVTLQGAADAKIALTSSVPRNNSLFRWLTDTGAGDEDTIKTVYSGVNNNIDAVMTPDGMAFQANISWTGGIDHRFKNEGFVCVDLNGAEGPTETTPDTLNNIINVCNNAAAFDVVRFNVDKEGTFTTRNCNAEGCNKAKQYLGID